jgi:hypothetical protein
MVQYALAIFEPDHCDTSCVIMYYCCYSDRPSKDPSESIWVVPGTLNLED